jgi:hypothetical protein
MSQQHPDQPPELRKRSHKSPNTKIGRNKKPPLHSASTTKNSHTSPRRIALRRKMNEALSCRERGLTYTAIAKQMRVSVSVVHGWVVQAMHALPIENAKLVLAMELKRLDGYLAAYHDKALLGDMPATKMALRILDHRARLLGLYPEHGSLAQVLVQAQSGDMGVPLIEFIVPNGAGGQRVAPADVDAAPPPASGGPYPWQRALPPPRERYPTPFGVVEVEGDRTAGPRTELDPGAPRPQGGGGESRLFRSPGRGTDWMGS